MSDATIDRDERIEALAKLNDAAQILSRGAPQTPRPTAAPYSGGSTKFNTEAWDKERLTAANWPFPSGGAFRSALVVRTKRSAAAIISFKRVAGIYFCVGYATKLVGDTWAAGPWAGPCEREWIGALQEQSALRRGSTGSAEPAAIPTATTSPSPP